MNEFLKILMERRSIREYDGRPIDRETLRQILAAGANAPSAHDSRPWHFAAVTSDTAKARLASALTGRFAEDMKQAGFSAPEIEARLARTKRIYSGAAAIVVLFAKKAQRENPLAKSGATEELMAAQSVALAAGQMLLAAHGLGLGACWFSAPLFCERETCEACAIDTALWQPQCLLTIGHPAQSPKEKPAPLLEDVATYL